MTEVVIDAEAMVQNKSLNVTCAKCLINCSLKKKKDDNTKTLTRATKILHPMHESGCLLTTSRWRVPCVACVRCPIRGHSKED